MGLSNECISFSRESGLADHKLLWHEATAGFHLLEDEVGDHPPVLLLALTHQPQRAVVHLNDHLQGIKASISAKFFHLLSFIFHMKKEQGIIAFCYADGGVFFEADEKEDFRMITMNLMEFRIMMIVLMMEVRRRMIIFMKEVTMSYSL